MPFGLIELGFAAWLGAADLPGRGFAAMLPSVSFNPRERAVSNWRWEAASHLAPPLGVVLPLILGRDPQAVTRCVRMNNYWCIKRAGWAGEIAADAEGHVAFASALEGADVAALLLRRYYVDYGRHSAIAIISHWAPASCGLAPSAAGAAARHAAADHLTTHGLGQTLRARFLAHRGRRIAGGGRMRGRRSVIPDRLIGARSAMPVIALEPSSGTLDLGSQTLAALPLIALGTAPRAETPDIGCVGDDARIRNYAAKTASGVAPDATADLKLFDSGGAPTPNLARVMANMSAVEIGPLSAGRALIASAVEHARSLAFDKLGLKSR